MIVITTKQVGSTTHASTKLGHVVGFGASPVQAAKCISKAMQDVMPGNILIASNTGHGFLIEQIDKLEYQDTPIWMHKWGISRSDFR